MSGEEGIVTAIEGSYALVRVVRKTSCTHCPSAVSCHIEADQTMIVKAKNSASAKIGQRVQLFIAPASILAASCLLYLVPLFGLVAGAIAGKILLTQLFPIIAPDILAAGSGFFTMTGIFAGIHFYEQHRKSKERFIPQITQIIL